MTNQVVWCVAISARMKTWWLALNASRSLPWSSQKGPQDLISAWRCLEGWNECSFLSFLWIFNRCCKGYFLSLTSKAYILFSSILIVESENRAIRVVLAQKRKLETSRYILVCDLQVGLDTFESARLILFFKNHSVQVASFIFKSARMDCVELPILLQVNSSIFESAHIICPIISYSARVGSSSMESARLVCL